MRYYEIWFYYYGVDDERRKLDAGQILIFESDWNDFCEGCGSVGPVVDRVREDDESVVS